MVEGPIEICYRLLAFGFDVIAAVLGFKYCNEKFYWVGGLAFSKGMPLVKSLINELEACIKRIKTKS